MTFSESEYSDNILQSMSESIIVAAPDLNIVLVNPATCRLLGYTPDELVGVPLTRVCPSGELFDATGVSEEHFYRAKDGREIPVKVSASAVRDGLDGEIQALVCVAQDITEAKQAAADTKLFHSTSMIAANMVSFDDALQQCLDQVCEYVGWPVGHVYVPALEANGPAGLFHFPKIWCS